jgi:hypothetical protein
VKPDLECKPTCPPRKQDRGYFTDGLEASSDDADLSKKVPFHRRYGSLVADRLGIEHPSVPSIDDLQGTQKIVDVTGGKRLEKLFAHCENGTICTDYTADIALPSLELQFKLPISIFRVILLVVLTG